MGFFSNIICDSRRTHSAFSLAGMVPFGLRLPSYFPERSAPVEERTEPVRHSVENAPAKRLREESTGFSETARQDQVQAETAARQVVSPSPAQYIPAGEPAQVRVNWESSPNPEAREQTGSESDETVTDASRTTRPKSCHGVDSFDVPGVQASASDSSIRESSSERARSRAGTTAVETQRRQQAGDARAGLATPPGQTKQENAAEWSGPSLGQPFLRELHEPIVSARRANAAVSSAADTRFEEPVVFRPSRSETTLDQRFVSSDHAPPPEERLCDPAKGRKPPEPSWNPPPLRDAFSARRNDREKLSSERFQRTAEPQVQIGTIEVVVLTQASPERRARSEARVLPDPASRHYLRNF